MPNLQPELAPVSEAITEGIRVEVIARHTPENSRPGQGEWVFQYTVRITNQSTETVQLISRHWIITDGLDHVEEVKGPGVIGDQPVLVPASDAHRRDARHLSDGPDKWRAVRYRDRAVRDAG